MSEVLELIPTAEPSDDARVDAAAQAARAWQRAGLARRLAVLQTAGRALSEQRDALTAALLADGLSHRLADAYGDWIVHQGNPELLQRYAWAHVHREDVGGGGELLVRRADGVVLLVVPANSPTINAAPMFSILLPGNAVLCRAPSNDGGVRFIADLLADALRDDGFDPALVSVVTGRSRDFLGRFLPAPAVRNVVFFGNATAGASVAEQAQKLGKKAVLELEGSDNMVVWRDAPINEAARAAIRALDFSTQPCPIPKHLLVHDAVYDAFVEAVLALAPEASRTVERDVDTGNLVPVGRPERYLAALEEVQGIGRLLSGGYRMDADGAPADDGLYVAPTFVGLNAADVKEKHLLCFEEEIAFPLIPIVRFAGPDDRIASDMVDVCRASPFGLRVSVWARDPARISEFATDLDGTGLLLFNDDHAQCPAFASPWGGPGRSGGAYGEHHLFWEKTSRLQAIAARRLDRAALEAVLQGLGCTGDARRPGLLEERPDGDEPAPVALTVVAGVATLTLCRPERHNAVDAYTVAALSEALDRVQADQTVRCLVLRGEGPSFCSGADLRMLHGLSTHEARRFMLEATWTFRRLQRMPMPVLAVVHGYCLGGGFELALHCDEILAAPSATFGFPEVGAGFVTTAGSVERLAGALGTATARRLLIGGGRFDGSEAAAAGLVATARSDDMLAVEAAQRIAALCALPPASVRAMKGLLRGRSAAEESASWIAELEAFETLLAERERP